MNDDKFLKQKRERETTRESMQEASPGLNTASEPSVTARKIPKAYKIIPENEKYTRNTQVCLLSAPERLSC